MRTAGQKSCARGWRARPPARPLAAATLRPPSRRWAPRAPSRRRCRQAAPSRRPAGRPPAPSRRPCGALARPAPARRLGPPRAAPAPRRARRAAAPAALAALPLLALLACPAITQKHRLTACYSHRSAHCRRGKGKDRVSTMTGCHGAADTRERLLPLPARARISLCCQRLQGVNPRIWNSGTGPHHTTRSWRVQRLRRTPAAGRARGAASPPGRVRRGLPLRARAPLSAFYLPTCASALPAHPLSATLTPQSQVAPRHAETLPPAWARRAAPRRCLRARRAAPRRCWRARRAALPRRLRARRAVLLRSASRPRTGPRPPASAASLAPSRAPAPTMTRASTYTCASSA